jgi:hypothetical protein
MWAVERPLKSYPDLEQPRSQVVAQSCLYAILSHRPRLVLVRPVRIVLLCFQRFRRAGLYAINISTAATAFSLLLSTTVLFVGPRAGLHRMGRWSGIALIGAYVLAIGAGAVIGALGGFLLTRKLLPRR